jgi:serine/threonine-protein kinase RsbW
MADMEELVRLDIPAQPAFVGVARSVVAAVTTTVAGVDDDRLEDLRLAVSEACTNAVEGAAGDRFVLRCLVDDEHLEIRIEDPGGALSSEVSAERGWGLQLITALVDDVAFATDGAGSSVSLRMVRHT